MVFDTIHLEWISIIFTYGILKLEPGIGWG